MAVPSLVGEMGGRMGRGARVGAVVLLVCGGLGGVPARADHSGVHCSGLTPHIVGTAGDDVLHGTEHSDVIWAGRGDDVVRGFGQYDVICGGPGDDLLFGGGGDDEVRGQGGADRVFGMSGRDRLFGQDGRDMLRGDRWSATRGGKDELRGGRGVDRLFGGGGGDTLEGGARIDVLRGEGGGDTAGFDGVGPVDVDLRLDRAITADGIEWLPDIEGASGSGRADVLRGTNGPNGFGAGRGDVVYAYGGRDLLAGSGARLYGGSGRDRFVAVGRTRAWGQGGNDIFVGLYPKGRSTLDGGRGLDRLEFHQPVFPDDRPVRINMATGEATLENTVIRMLSFEAASGTVNDDVLLGSAGVDRLDGDEGEDVVRGRDGDDLLRGGDGVDTIIGGDGYDRCTDYKYQYGTMRRCEDKRFVRYP